MKKQLLLLGSVLSSLFSLAQVANGDFENWTVNYLYDVPTPWSTSVSESGGQLTNTTQSSDAAHLLSSVRLETVLAAGDTNFGFVLLGDMGDNGPENGHPYTGVTGNPDSLIFWAKYDIQATDSATALFATTYIGSPTSLNAFKIYGTQSTWVRKAYALGTIFAVDSVVVAFASSDALNEFGIPGSWIMIDNVQVKTTTGATWTPPNNSFETWDAVNSEEADDWYSSNLFYSEDTTVFKTMDAYANTYAAKITTILGDYNDTLVGYLSNGPSVNGGWFSGVPYTAVPSTMDLYYKYLPSGVDSAQVYLELMEGTNVIGGGFTQLKNTVSSYTALSIPVTQYSPGTVDTMRITFSSGRNPGSTLFVDAVSLNGGTVSTDEITLENSLKHFPNPVENELTVTFNASKSSNGTIEVFDVNGKLVISKNLNIITGANIQTINTEGLTQGVYTYVINNGGNRGVNKFIKK